MATEKTINFAERNIRKGLKSYQESLKEDRETKLKRIDDENSKAWEEANSHEWPKNYCALCESTFEEDLNYTDGKAFACDECAKDMPHVFHRK